MLNLISLGAGAQSTYLTLSAAKGVFGVIPDAAIFADTQAEPFWVYENLRFITQNVPFPVYRVTAGNLATDTLNGVNSTGQKFYSIPWRMENALGRRQCTREYKLKPIYQKIRELGATAKNPARLWVGISMEEAHRAKPARVKYVENVWPLLDHRIYRLDCLKWMADQGYPVPRKSACVFCPYHGNDEWRAVKEHDPDGWRLALKVDESIRVGGVKQYAHRDLVPLNHANLDKADQADLFGEECEGMCGV